MAQKRIIDAYKELLDWEILPTQEITKLMNMLIPIVNGEDDGTEYKNWFAKEKDHLFFALERIGELEKICQMEMSDELERINENVLQN